MYNKGQRRSTRRIRRCHHQHSCRRTRPVGSRSTGPLYKREPLPRGHRERAPRGGHPAEACVDQAHHRRHPAPAPDRQKAAVAARRRLRATIST